MRLSTQLGRVGGFSWNVKFKTIFIHSVGYFVDFINQVFKYEGIVGQIVGIKNTSSTPRKSRNRRLMGLGCGSQFDGDSLMASSDRITRHSICVWEHLLFVFLLCTITPRAFTWPHSRKHTFRHIHPFQFQLLDNSHQTMFRFGLEYTNLTNKKTRKLREWLPSRDRECDVINCLCIKYLGGVKSSLILRLFVFIFFCIYISRVFAASQDTQVLTGEQTSWDWWTWTVEWSGEASGFRSESARTE